MSRTSCWDLDPEGLSLVFWQPWMGFAAHAHLTEWKLGSELMVEEVPDCQQQLELDLALKLGRPFPNSEGQPERLEE